MRSYGQYCPIARASEILAERWTPLVLRNLMFGADTFSQILRGVPAMSRSMLVTRLKELERAGLVDRVAREPGRGSRYLLTEAGRDLAGVMTALAAWGERWVDVGPEHTDPGFALWAWCLVQLDRAELPDGRVVVAFDFVDQPPGNRHFWLLVENGDARSATPIPVTSPPYASRPSRPRWSTGTAAGSRGPAPSGRGGSSSQVTGGSPRRSRAGTCASHG